MRYLIFLLKVLLVQMATLASILSPVGAYSNRMLSRQLRIFFAGTPVTRGISSTLLLPLPKKSSPETFGDFRPDLSLCNFSNKIITKILAPRLSGYIHQLISPNHSGFTPDRNISDNILLAQKLVHSKECQGWVIIC
jgi:hypothetical protein